MFNKQLFNEVRVNYGFVYMYTKPVNSKQKLLHYFWQKAKNWREKPRMMPGGE